ncbi:MAG: NlpC/P60 family protein [Ruminococcaceae bacterium]|nr:NlpC/P60 family protein [Oscillospiraceae bacterium]
MDITQKQEILISTALSYFERGKNIQYDQRCMDRSLFLTPRRRKLLPPEAATGQNTQYFDCSSFVGAVYYEAFGYELPHDLTWHMVDYVTPRVYYHEFTHSKEEHDIVKKQILDVLKSGDVITYDRGVGSGHTLIYMGDHKYIHCTTNGRADSYDYQNCKSREYEAGLFVDLLENKLLTEKGVFSEKIRRVSIARPLLEVGEPTKRTLARVGECDGLYVEVLTNPVGFENAKHGDEIEFCLKVTEKKGNSKKSIAKIEVPDFANVIGENKCQIEILPNSTTTITFKVTVEDKNVALLKDVKMYLGEFEVFVPMVLLGKTLSNEQRDILTNQLEKVKTFDLQTVSNIYENAGIKVETSETKVLQNLFYLHDSPTGDVLARRTQNPVLDGAVYSLFGGTGVITPEMIRYPFIRTNRVIKRDFLVGDIIVISNDACGKESFSAVYLGDKIVGKTKFGGEYEVLEGNRIDEFIDSLLGKFCFVVLRPSFKE